MATKSAARKRFEQWVCRVLMTGSLSAAVGGCGDPIPQGRDAAADASQPDAAEGGVPGRIEVLAGSLGGAGNLDGPRTDARFSLPSAVARTADGTLFVADTANLTIRQITPDGLVSTVAGRSEAPGTADGVGAQARFRLPASVALARDGALLIADSDAGTIRRLGSDGVVTTWAGRAGEQAHVDGSLELARFINPESLAVDVAGIVYVADRGAHVIRRIDPETGLVTTLAGTAGEHGHRDGDPTSALFDGPFGVAVAPDGSVAVADTGNNVIRWIGVDGSVTTLAGTPGAPQSDVDGNGAAAGFGRPRALVFLPDGELLVADTFNDRLRHVTRAGDVTTFAGGLAGIADGPAREARFQQPHGIVVADEGGAMVIYVADAGGSTIRRIAGGLVETFAGQAVDLRLADGPSADARFFGPNGIAAAADGALIVADAFNDSLRRVAVDGTTTTLAGRAGEPGVADGAIAVARFASPTAVVSDGAGGYFVADAGNRLIRHISAEMQVSTYAGVTGDRGGGLVDGPRLEARFAAPVALSRAPNGNLYVVDAVTHTVRVVGADGVVRTIAGNGLPGFRDGDGATARFDSPQGVYWLDDARLLVADTGNCVLRVVSLGADAQVTTLAGSPPLPTGPRCGARDGLGEEAQFDSPRGIVDAGNDVVLIADTNSDTLRRVRLSDGDVRAVAGTFGSYGLREGELPGNLFEPVGLARDASGRLAVSHLGGVLRIEGL